MLNKVILLGRLGRDPELRYTQSGKAVANVSLAVSRRSGEKEVTAWVDVAIWGDSAERFTKFHTKGDLAYVEGRLDQDSWEDRESGKRRTKLKVTAESWKFASEILGGTGAKTKREDQDDPF